MTSQPEDLAERVRGAFERLPVEHPPIDRIVARGRRRFVVRITTYVVTVSLVVVAGAVGIARLAGLAGLRPGGIELPGGRTIQKPRVVHTIQLTSVCLGVTAGEGGIWLGGSEQVAVIRIDPGSDRQIATIRTEDPPYEMATGEGKAWAVTGYSLIRIDPRTGRATRIDLGQGVTPAGVAVGDRSVWVAAFEKVLRIDPRTGRVIATLSGLSPGGGIALGAGGVWVTSGHVRARIDPSTNRVAASFTLDLPPADRMQGLGQVATGAGAVWVMGPRGVLYKIDPRTGRVAAPPISVGGADPGMVVWRGVVWAIQSSENNRSSMIMVDGSTGEVVGDPVPVGRYTARIAAGDGSLWVPAVSEHGNGVLYRIAP
jgi:streptogramin lyase